MQRGHFAAAILSYADSIIISAAGAGEYQVRYRAILGAGTSWSYDPDDGTMRRTCPAKGEWSGTLASGETRLTVEE